MRVAVVEISKNIVESSRKAAEGSKVAKCRKKNRRKH